MSTAREAILERVRGALGDARRPAEAAEPSAHPAPGVATDSRGLTRRFATRVEAYGASVRECAPAQLREVLEALCAEQGAQRLACPADVPAEWRPEGVELLEDEPALSAEQLDAVDGVLTGAACAAAESGTLALDHGPRQGRRALTLLPDLHVCVLESATIVPDIPELIAALAPAVGERRPLTLVSGPSATSDIELDRVEGVHGPRRLAIVLLGEAPPDLTPTP